MEYRQLGRSGILASRLAFGTLTLAQKKMPLKEGAFLLEEARAAGINLFDTAELYGTYRYLRRAFKEGGSPRPIIISRSYAVGPNDMKQSLDRALRGTGSNLIDIFMLHQQESALTLEGHYGALEFLFEARTQGLVRAVGISTHHLAAVRAAARMDSIDVIFAILNDRGLGIQDGNTDEMQEALKDAHDAGKGILVMKALGGGHLSGRAGEALRFCFRQPFVDSVVIGMQSGQELRFNLSVEAGKAPPDELEKVLSSRMRSLLIEDCQGCGKCLASCRAGALRINKGRAVVNRKKCLLCGYCAFSCPEFCIKVI
jgi:aryl-alcohol dehydrogenase-like predicted oxidoreductase